MNASHIIRGNFPDCTEDGVVNSRDEFCQNASVASRRSRSGLEEALDAGILVLIAPNFLKVEIERYFRQ